MKNLTIKGKILSCLTAVFALVLVAALAQMIVTINASNRSSDAGQEDLSAYDIVFSGDITLFDEPYDIVLKGKDGAFTVDANAIKNIMEGSYAFTEGQGWTFVFDDSFGTNVRSQYDSAEKKHSFLYKLDMGSRGTGTLRMFREDPDFKPADVSWNDIPSFSGTAVWFGGVLTAPAVCSCDAEGNFKAFCTGGEVDEIHGTYTQAGDVYTLTAEDGTVCTSEIDEETGLPAFKMTVHRPTLASYGPMADSEVLFVLTVLTED